MTVLQSVRRTVLERQLLKRGDSVLVALSGGPDSVALLHILSRLCRTMRLGLKAVYINHKIRPRAAGKEEKFCRRLCEQLDIELILVREDIPALASREKTGLEETAREFRYKVFDQIAQANRHDRIALGHHADDQVETILFRLFRGTGRSGLLGIPYRRGRIVRPLLDLTKADILGYLRKNGLTYCEDRSNRSLMHKRNYIRHKLLAAVRENLNPRVDSALLNLADSLAAEEEYLEQVVSKSKRKCLSVTPGGKLSLDLNRFGGYDKWLRRRLLRHCLRASSPSRQMPGRDVVERLDRLALSSEGTLSLPGSVQAVIADERLLIFRASPGPFCQRLEPGKKLLLEWPCLHFSSRLCRREAVRLERQARASRVFLDWDKLSPPLEVRSIRLGDRFRPLGMAGRKKVGNYLTDRKVPGACRDEIPVVCDREGIIWLVGHEIADRAKVRGNTRKVLTVGYGIRRPSGDSTV